MRCDAMRQRMPQWRRAHGRSKATARETIKYQIDRVLTATQDISIVASANTSQFLQELAARAQHSPAR